MSSQVQPEQARKLITNSKKQKTMNNTFSDVQLEAVSAFFSKESINKKAVCLQNAEDGLERAAYEDDDINLFRFAHEVREIRREIEQIEKLLGYEPDRDQ